MNTTNHSTIHHFPVVHYIFLALLLAAGIGSFFHFQGYPDIQFKISILMSVVYFIWGITHHRVKGDLHPIIVVEYLLISVFALLLLRGAIYH